MEGIKQILVGARDYRLKAGGAVSVRVVEELRKYRTKLSVAVVCLFIILLAAIVYVSYYLMTNPDQITHAKAVAGFIGVGTGGMLELLRRVWKGWNQTNLLLILLEDASEAQVTAIMDKLIKNL
jgi:hypothetical protein